LVWALEWARRLGYDGRYEWLGGVRGGCCEVAGRRVLFVDVSAHISEQLEQILESLQHDPQYMQLHLTLAQQDALGVRRAA
jgi:hypothetical protein